MSNFDILKNFTSAVESAGKRATSAYDTAATVKRIDGKTAWVHIPGGVEETPVQLTINAKVGDTVQLRVGGGSAWITGNQSAPPTDDTTAEKAMESAKAAAGTATEFVTDSNNGIFVHPKNDDSTGVWITDAVEIVRNGYSYIKAYIEDSIAKVRVGLENSGHSVIDTNGMRVYGGNGYVQLANIGYGEGASASGTANAPYYTFGVRGGSGAATPKGNYSFCEGYDCTATAYCAHAEGVSCDAYGVGAHAEGSGTFARAADSHAEGSNTDASGSSSHAEGLNTLASGRRSHAGGYETIAAGDEQVAIGKYNVEDSNDTYVVIIGNGSGESDRRNALTIDWDGSIQSADGFDSGIYPQTTEYTTTISYSAGTIGTRGARVTLADIATECPTGCKLGGFFISSFSNTSDFNPSVTSNGTNIYLSAYRATANAVSNISVTVSVLWIPDRSSEE